MRFPLASALLIGALVALVLAQTPPPTSQAPLDNCSTMQSCDDCLSANPPPNPLPNPNCGWCAPTQTCHPGNITGPTDGTRCVSQWFADECPDCVSHDTCLDCLKEPACGWCVDPTASSCQPLGGACPAGEAPQQTCPCEYYEQCADCLDDGGNCVFCVSSGRCETIDPVNGNCANAGDELFDSCPCNRWTSCDSCNVQEGCGWCEGKGGCIEIQTATCQLVHTCHTCPSSHGFNAGSFVGGLFLMLGIVVLLAGSYFLYTTYFAGRQQYQTVQ